MFTLFTPPGIDTGGCSGGGVSGGGGTEDDDDDLNTAIDDSDDDSDDDDDEDDDVDDSTRTPAAVNVSMDSAVSEDSSVVRRYCEIWKAKRREEKERARRQRRLWNLQSQNREATASTTDIEVADASTSSRKVATRTLSSTASIKNDEVAATKQVALDIQRSFELKFDEKDDTQRLERYGNRGLHPRRRMLMK
jgi:hypothetical protein